ncbi:hypothetical protein ABVT39_012746 [Epinephelus coioides]
MANTDTPGYSTVISVPLRSSHHISTPSDQLQLPHRPRYIHRGSGRRFVLSKHGDHGNPHRFITSLWSAGRTFAQQWRHQNTATPVAKDRSAYGRMDRKPGVDHSVLDCLNLHQSVVGPTHTKGHTLDLVITDSIHISDLHVQDIGISDHYAVTFRTPPPSPLTKPQRLISFRNFKNIDSTSLNQHLQLLSPPSNTSLTDLMDYYNHNLHSILDFHAPLKTRTVTFTRSAPWFTEELRLLKRTGRVLERAYVTSGLTVHKLAYREHRRRYAKELSKARSAHYSNIINNNPVLSHQVTSHPPHNTCLNSPPQCSRRSKK